MLTLTKQLSSLATTTGFIQTGESWRVQISPDIFTGERINVGVAVRLPSGATRVMVMVEPGRLACFYGEIGAENILFAAQLYKEAVEAGMPCPVDNIFESDHQPIFNTDPDEALRSLYFDQVSAAKTDHSKKREEDTIKRDMLTTTVYNFIRKARPLEADCIIPQSPMAIVSTAHGSRPARVPIQGVSAFAGLESAAIKTSHTIQFNLMNALLDVEVACRAKQIKHIGMFVLRPDTKDEKWNTLVDNAIDKVLWRAPRECIFEADANPDALAEKIIAFALPKAA